MDSDSDTPCGVGCPIRKSRDQRLLASPPGLSQRATSFIASQCQGIHQMPFVSRLSTTPNGKYQSCIAAERVADECGNSLFVKTHVGHVPARLSPVSCDASDRFAGRARLGHVTTRLFTRSINKTQRWRIHTATANRDFIPSTQMDPLDASPPR